jgi:hypothetical protein
MKPFKLPLLAAALLSAVLTGCATLRPPELPAEARGVVLAAVSSGFVRVRQPFLRSHERQLQVYGTVAAASGSRSTDQTYIEISFLDAAGHLLRASTVQFSPRNLVSRFPGRSGSYSLTLGNLPVGTVRIEVRARQGRPAA